MRSLSNILMSFRNTKIPVNAKTCLSPVEVDKLAMQILKESDVDTDMSGQFHNVKLLNNIKQYIKDAYSKGFDDGRNFDKDGY